MLIAQISDMHVKADGELLYRRIDTAGYLERAVAHVNALDPRPDLVIATGCIRPHYFAGFGAGVKAIFPGLGQAAAIRGRCAAPAAARW